LIGEVMLKPFIRLTLLTCLVSSSAFAGMKVSLYEKEKNTETFKIYLTGVVNGFAFSNTELENKNQKAFYCPSRNESIKVETYIKLLDEKISVYPRDRFDKLEIEPMLLAKLIEVYPCK
jgi:hypothetical protein